MRVLVYLPNDVPAFTPNAAELARLEAATPANEIVLCDSERDFLGALGAAEAVVVWRLDAALYEKAPMLRHVFTPAAGKELVAPDPQGRVSVHFGSFHGHLMAESLLGMLLFMTRRFGASIDAQRAHTWERASYSSTRRLAGQVALLIGYGTIAEHCGRLLKAVGMTVHGVRRTPSRGGKYADRIFGRDALLGAVADADHVACLLPGDTQTDGLLGRSAFERMKQSACVYNLGRGNAIDVPALVAALEIGKLAGAFLDVVPEEPLPPGSPLWDTKNLYISPHSSAINSQYLDCYFAELALELNSLERR